MRTPPSPAADNQHSSAEWLSVSDYIVHRVHLSVVDRGEHTGNFKQMKYTLERSRCKLFSIV